MACQLLHAKNRWPPESGANRNRFMEHAGQTIVRIFSGREFIPEGTMFMDLFVPFWGPNEGRFETMQPTRVARYVEGHGDFLAMSGIEDCDFVVFPVEYQLCTRPDRAAVLHRLAGDGAGSGETAGGVRGRRLGRARRP